jgi:Domain of unknown function (DUF6378)
MTDQEEMLAARAKQHGDFSVHAEITQRLKAIAQSDIGGYSSMSFPQREAVDMILHKIGRILAGNPNHHDHWDDIAGYAKITRDRIP